MFARQSVSRCWSGNGGLKKPVHWIAFFVFVLWTLCAGIVPPCALGASEVEPNNTLGSSNVIASGETVTGSLNVMGDVDWYRITLASPGRLRISVTDVPYNVRPYITLYNRHADYMYVYAYAVNDGDDVHLTHDMVEPGTYFIRLNDSDNDFSPQNYTLTTAFTPVQDPQEPNNRIGESSLLTSGTLSGNIFSGADEDWFKIYVNSGDTLYLTVEPSQEMQPSLTLYNADFGYMYQYAQAVNPGDTVHLNYAVTEAGFYYIRVADVRGLSHTDPYTLTIGGGNPGFVPPQNPVTAEVEVNGRLGAANLIEADTMVSGTIGHAGDADWFRLELTQSGQLTVALQQVPTNIALQMRLYNSSGGQVLFGQATDPGALFSLTLDAPGPGTYYLQVNDRDSQVFSAQTYTFEVSLVPVADPYEPNNGYGDAKAVDQQNRISAFLFPTGDQDWYTIQVTQPADLRVILSDLPENISGQINLYNLSKVHLAGKSGNPGIDTELVYQVQAAGTYYLLITDGGNNDESTNPYTMSVFGADFGAYAPTAHIDLIEPGSVVVGDLIEFSGSGFDSDGTITGYAWRSSIDGFLGDQAAFTTSALSQGTHTIYFKVQDDEGIWSTEVREVVYVGSSVSDEVEPNAPIGLANEIALGRPVNAKVNVAGDEDHFRIYVDRPGRLVFTLTNVPNNLSLCGILYDRHLGYLYAYACASADGENVSVAYHVTEPGFYYLKAYDSHGAWNADYTYVLTATLHAAADPQEPNDSMLDAHTMQTGSVEGYIFPNGDQDWYRVWVDAGSTLTVDITGTPADLRPSMTLYDRNRSYLYVYATAQNDGDPVQVSHIFAEAGFVYIQVYDADGQTNWTHSYQMTVTGANPGYVPPESPVAQEQEDNDRIADANPAAFGAPVTGTIGDAGDVDWYRFRMPSAGVIHAHVQNVASHIRGRVRLFQDDGGQIAYRQATNPGDDLTLDARVTRPGTYFALVDSLDGYSYSEQPYQLTLTMTGAADAFEPNGRFGDATVLGGGSNRIQALIFDQYDEDWYRVTCDGGSVLQVTVADVPQAIRPAIEFYDIHGQWLASRGATNPGQELSLSYTVAAGSDIFIRIRDLYGAFSTDPYTLIINGARFASYTPMAFIDSVSPNPVLQGAVVTLEGHGEDADGEIIGYAWRSSLDGDLSNSRLAALDTLSKGTHTLLFKVKDNDQNWSPETSTILYVGMEAPGEEEPNNAIGEANPLPFDVQYSGTIEPGYDQDYYRIHVPQAGRLVIHATNPTGSAMRTYLTMYTPDADYAYVNTGASNPGDPVMLAWDLSQPGNYFLSVHDAAGVAGSRYTITATLQTAADPYEPNGNAADASALTPGDTVQGYVFPSGDEDWYAVTVDKPGRLDLSLTSVPAEMRGYVTVYDRNAGYTYHYAYADNDGDSVFLSYNIAIAGTYFVRVHDADGQGHAGATYTFATALQEAVDPFETNNDFWRSTPLSQSPVNAMIFPAGDQDWYRFYAQSGANVQMQVDNGPANLRMHLTLYNGNAGYLYAYAYTDTEGGWVTLNYQVPETGYYYLQVYDRDNDFSTQPYRLTVTGADLTHVPGTQPAVVETEPNNEGKHATLIGTEPVQGALGVSGDRDWYRFVVEGPSRLTVSLAVAPSLRTAVVLYDGNYAQKASRYAENKGDASAFVFAIDTAGTWYLEVYDQDGASSQTPYSLDLTLDRVTDPFEPNPDFAGAAPLSFGQPVQAMLFPSADRDWFALNVEEAGLIRLELTAVPSNIQAAMLLYNANYQQVFYRNARNGGDPVQETYLAPGPGTYYVQVYDQYDAAYSLSPYTLTALFTPMVDPTEPNDRFSEATPLAQTNQAVGLIYPNGDADWYRFTVSQPGTVRIQMTQTEGIAPYLELYTGSKHYLTRVYRTNQGDGALLTHEVDRPDTYYLLVRDRDNVNHSLQPYVLTIEGGAFDTYHPTAIIEDVRPNPSLTGQAVTFTGAATDPDGSVAAYEWASDRDGPFPGGAVVSVSHLSAGTHRVSLRVQDNEGNWSGRVYRNVYVTDTIVDEWEYNNSTAHANAVPLNTWIRGAIHPVYDEDFYRIYLDQEGLLSALVDPVPANMRPQVEFYDADGNWTYRYAYANFEGEWVSYGFFAAPGWYYVKVRDNAGNDRQDTYGLFFGFTPSPDRYEPNDSVKEATLIPADTTLDDARICREGDEDWYRMQIPERGRLELGVTGSPQEMRGYITIYNPNVEYVYVYGYAYNDGDDVFLTYDVPQPGTYYVRIHDNNGRAHTEPYTLTSRFTPVPDPFEDNQDAGHAALLPTETVQGTIFPAGDEDWYRIHAEAGSVLFFSLTGTPADMRGNLVLYGRDLEYLYVYQSANNDGDNLHMSFAVPGGATGFYYLQVYDANHRAHLSPYTLTVTGGQPGFDPTLETVTTEVEPNGWFAQANPIAVGQTVAGVFNPANEEDWFRFYLNAPGILEIAHTGVPEDVTSEMWVYNAAFSQIGYRRTTNPGEENVLTMPVTEPGVYRVRLADNDRANAASGEYSLLVTHTPVVDTHEPNGNYGYATPMGQESVQGYVFPDSDEDWYRVYVRTPGLLSVSVDAMAPEVRPYLTLFDANKNQVGYWLATNDGQVGADLIEYQVPAPGFYFVRFHDEGMNSYSATAYALRVNGADFSTAPLLEAIGDRVIDEGVEYAFTVFATDPDNPQDLVFSASGLPPGASFDPATRTFRWQPAYGQAEVYPGVHFQVSDGVYSDSEDITITVRRVSRAPVLAPIGNRTAAVGSQLAFQVTATDPDAGDTLAYTTGNLPPGASFDPETRTFTWTPTSGQEGLHTGISFEVTDGTWTDFEYIDIQVLGGAAVPEVSTGAVLGVWQDGARISGQVSSDGGTAVTERGIAYSTTPEPTAEGSKVVVEGGLGPFEGELAGLSPGVRYYARAYATNAQGTAYGVGVSFTTLVSAPNATASPDSHDFGSVESGQESQPQTFTVTNTGTEDLILGTVWLAGADGAQYGLQNDTCSGQTLAPQASRTVEVVFAPASAGQKYAILSFGSNDPDTPVLGVPLNGTGVVAGEVPLLNTDPVTDISRKGGTGGGEVIGEGGSPVMERGIVYSRLPGPTVDLHKVPSGSGMGVFSCTLTDLTAGTTYYVRAYAINEAGVGYGPEVSFTTLPPVLGGDVNLDGRVDLADALMVLQVLAGGHPGALEKDADVNGDGRLGQEEVLHILRFAAGLTSGYLEAEKRSLEGVANFFSAALADGQVEMEGYEGMATVVQHVGLAELAGATDIQTAIDALLQRNFPCGEVSREDGLGGGVVFTFTGQPECGGITGTVTVTPFLAERALGYTVQYGNVSVNGCIISGTATVLLSMESGKVTTTHSFDNMSLCGQILFGTLTVVFDAVTRDLVSLNWQSQSVYMVEGFPVMVMADITYSPAEGMSGVAMVVYGEQTYNCQFTGMMVDAACGIPTSGVCVVNGVTLDFSNTTCENPVVTVTLYGMTFDLSLEEAKSLFVP